MCSVLCYLSTATVFSGAARNLARGILSGVNLAGILGGRRVDPDGLVGVGRGRRYPFPPGEAWGGGYEKNNVFHLNWRVLVHSASLYPTDGHGGYERLLSPPSIRRGK